MGGLQGPFERLRKISPFPGNRSPDRPARTPTTLSRPTKMCCTYLKTLLLEIRKGYISIRVLLFKAIQWWTSNLYRNDSGSRQEVCLQNDKDTRSVEKRWSMDIWIANSKTYFEVAKASLIIQIGENGKYQEDWENCIEEIHNLYPSPNINSSIK